MDIYAQAVAQIIKEQQVIIGPIALDQAKKVRGVQFRNAGDVSVVGDGKIVLSDLVSQFEKFFGRASVEVCKDAIKEISPSIPPEKLPDILK